MAWVPYPGEPLTCGRCGSARTTPIKRTGERCRSPRKDFLRCNDCGHTTDRWARLLRLKGGHG